MRRDRLITESALRLDTVELWRSSRQGPTVVIDLQRFPHSLCAPWAQVGHKFLCPRPILDAV